MIKLLLKASEVPSGSAVKKIRGNKTYRIVSELVVYDLGSTKRVIKAEEGALFLTHDGSSANSINKDTMVVWEVDSKEALDFISDGEYNPDGSITLNNHEVQSGSSRVNFAENLILQLPREHDGRNTWLLNYGAKAEAIEKRDRKVLFWDDRTCSANLKS